MSLIIYCRKANPHANVEEILFFREAELECSIWVAVSSAGLGQSKNLILVCFSFIIQRFVEGVIKLLRKEFDYRCPLTVAQVPLMKRKIPRLKLLTTGLRIVLLIRIYK